MSSRTSGSPARSRMSSRTWNAAPGRKPKCAALRVTTGRPLAVVTPGLVPFTDHVTEPAPREGLDPALRLLGVARHVVEECPEELRRAQPHVLVGLVDQQLVQSELVGRDVAESASVLLHACRELCGGMHFGHEVDTERGRGVDLGPR